MINNEIDFMMSKAHKLSLIDSQRRFNEENKLMNAMQCIKMQELIKVSMDRDMNEEESGALFKSDVGLLIENLNKVMRKQFEIDKNTSLKFKETEVRPISYADMMKPMFSDCGQILGFELRKDFVMMSYQNSNFDPNQVKKIIRHCLYVNRMMNDGLVEDYILRKVGQNTNKVDKEMQTESPDTDALSPEDQCLAILKKHLIDLMTRMNPTKKGYYTIVMAEMKLEKLLDYKVESVYISSEDKEK